MQKVPINLVAEGMILAKPIINDKGMTLCAEGTALTESLIERLRVMNVTILAIKGHPLDMGGADKTAEEKVMEMTGRFARLEGDPLMDSIRDAIAKAIRDQESEQQAEEAKEGA